MKKSAIKILFLIVIIGVAMLNALITPSFATEKNQTIVTYILVNDVEYFDIEILLDKNDKIFLPIKQIADVLEIPITMNHSTKEFTFEVNSEKKVRVSKSDIFINDKKINHPPNIYLKSGIMSDVKDEIFTTENILSEVFDCKISTDKSELSVKLDTPKKLSYIKEIQPEKEPYEETTKETFKAYKEVIIPTEKKKISLDTIELSNSTTGDNLKQIYQNSQDSSYTFNNNSRFTAKGSAFGGDYSVDFNTNNYTDKFFSFGGLSFKYKNKFDDYDYEIGKVTGFRGDDYSIGTQLLGVQLFDYDPKTTDYRNIEGRVDEKSIVEIYVDDEYYSTLNTYRGYFSLRDIYFQKEPHTIRLEEVKSDGTKETFYTKTYPKYKDMLLEDEVHSSLFAGISGFNDRLFSQNGYIYQMNAKKFVMGGNKQYGLKDNLFYDSKVLFDKVISQNPDVIWAYNNSSVFSSGTYRNANVLEGLTVTNSVNYYVNDDFKVSLTGAISSSNDLTLAPDKQNDLGYSLVFGSEYKKDNYSLKAGLYNQSSKFYLAGSDSGFISDRIGAKISGTYSFKTFNFNASYNKYFSNLQKEYDGGLTDFDEVNFGFSGRIPKVGQVRLSSNVRKGENGLGRNLNYYYDLNFSRMINDKWSIEVGKQESSYDTKYLSGVSQNGFSSLFSNIYTKSIVRLPKNKGILEVGHDMTTYASNGIDNSYRVIKVNYTFPEFKRILLSIGLGYKYAGMEKGLNYSANVGYRMKSGTVVSLNYQFNQNGGYLFDNMYIPQNARHSINLNFNDTYAFMPSGLKSVGYSDENKGYVDISAYLDKNKNGVFDEGDVPVENVPIKVSWKSEPLYTKTNGKCPFEAVEKGVYRVKVDNEGLMATLSSPKESKDSYLVMVDGKRNSKVEFALKSTVGNIKGKLKVIDDFGRNVDIREFIVVLIDEENREVAYSTVENDGSYYFSGIEPGKYLVKLDDGFVQANNLADYEGKSKITVEVPYEYKDFVDINNIDLTYKSW